MWRSRTTSASAAPTARWCSVVSEDSGSPEPEPPPASGPAPDAGAVRAAPRLEVGLDRFGSLGLHLLSLIPAGVLLVWLFLHLTSHPADRTLPWRLALFGLSLLLSIAVQRYRRRLRSIRWQLQLPDRQPGSGWLLGQPDQTPSPGRPEVMIDLNHWMLLRWHPNHGGCDVWLTVSRRDLRPHWHPLRCALFRHPDR